MLVKRKCLKCGANFEKYICPSRFNLGWGRYCSKKCSSSINGVKMAMAWQTQNPKITKNCLVCGKSFTYCNSKAKRTKFCSQACFGKYYSGKNGTSYKGTLLSKSCITCGKTFKTYFISQMCCSKQCVLKTDGRYVANGYVYILFPDHPFKTTGEYIAEHRLIAEHLLGRFITKWEQVHHINEIRDDNRPENLYLMPNRKAHLKYHLKPYPLVSNII